MMRSSGYNRFGVLMGTSWPASCPRSPRLQGDFSPMITLILLQRAFCATACIHFVEDDLTHHVTVIVRPPAYHGVELGDQIPSRGLLMRLHHFPDVPEKCFHILAGWCDDQFPRILAEMLAQEIEAVLNRGEVGFRR